MAAINFPTATSNGQTFEADTGVIYTYVGTPPNGFWSGTFGTAGLTTLDGRYIAKNDGNTVQTILTQGLKFNNGTSDTVVIDGVNGQFKLGSAPAGGTLGVKFAASTSGIIVEPTTATLNQSYIDFNNSAGATAGQITQNGTNTVNYSTSSDYRLKENVTVLSNGIARIKQLLPKRFNFIDSDITVDGFLAHEAQAVVPEAVTGDKDGERMQSIDQSKLIPVLTAGLQESITKIEALELNDKYAFNNSLVVKQPSSALNQPFASFLNNAGNSAGFIVQNSINSVAYTTVSDYRLQENTTELAAATQRFKQLAPKQFNFTADPNLTIDGFVAHEAQAVVPEAIIGQKDGSVFQSIDHSKFVPLITGALQESITRLDSLETNKNKIKNELTIQHSSSLLNQPFTSFLNSVGGPAGAIIQNGVNSVTYSTSSDYRLKDNVVELTGAIPRLKQLAPKRFNFKAASDITVDGFIAHEAQIVVPEAVTGTHNQLDGNGNPVYQGIDQSRLVPLLTAALQDAITRIENLESEVSSLKGA